METIIQPISRALIKAELTADCCLDQVSRGACQLYWVDNTNAPNTLLEIGRLREIAFRSGGGGTGKAVDLDRFDLDPSLGFGQLILWDAEAEEIMGGYRLLPGSRCLLDANGQPDMPSAHLFHFSQEFIEHRLPKTLELSRSFIVETHRRTSQDARRSIFVLDCLLMGIGVLMNRYGMEAIFGKVTFYPDYPQEAFALVTAFMEKYGLDQQSIRPYHPYTVPPAQNADTLFSQGNYKADFIALNQALREMGTALPPILKTYIRLAYRLAYYGSAVNDIFGNVIEMGLLFNRDDILPERYANILNIQQKCI